MNNEDLNLYSIARLKELFGTPKQGNDDFIICDPHEPLQQSMFRFPCKLNAYIIGICMKGKGRLSINLNEFEVSAGMMVINFPENIIQIKSISDDLEMRAFIVSENFLREMHIDIRNLVPIYVEFKNRSYLKLNDQEMHSLKLYTELLEEALIMPDAKYTKEVIQKLSAAMVYRISSILNKEEFIHQADDSSSQSRRELIFKRFMELVSDHHKEQRNVGFYASKLAITPKYLSTLIKEVSGKTAADWIDEFVILEAKALLRYSDKSIQEIAYILNFSTQSFFGKYFKHHTGMSPGAYKLQES